MHERVLKSACNTLSASMYCPRKASMTVPGTARSEEVICGFVSVNWLCSFTVCMGCSMSWQWPLHQNTTCILIVSLSDQGLLRSFQLPESQDGQQNSHAGRLPALFNLYAHWLSEDENIPFPCMARMQFSTSVWLFSSIS